MYSYEYQYSQWFGRGDDWWIDGDRSFKTKKSLKLFVEKMNSKYEFIKFRIKEKREKLEDPVVDENTVIIYTDGSAFYKDKKGGIGVYIKTHEGESIISQGYYNTTNNRMELRAVIEAMRFIEDKSLNVHIFSDSEYVINCFSNRIFDWVKFDFEGRKNVDLLIEGLSELLEFEDGKVNFHWCKGHSGIEGNEIADILAGEGRLSDNQIRCI